MQAQTKIEALDPFQKSVKRLRKKFRNVDRDLLAFAEALMETPMLGVDLGNNLRKVRWANSDKKKGKSDGYRVITYYLSQESDELTIYLVDVYDKSEAESIPVSVLINLLRDQGL